jgi:hypothetical protein
VSGCADVPKRCGDDKAKCTFDGAAHISLKMIRVSFLGM